MKRLWIALLIVLALVFLVTYFWGREHFPALFHALEAT